MRKSITEGGTLDKGAMRPDAGGTRGQPSFGRATTGRANPLRRRVFLSCVTVPLLLAMTASGPAQANGQERASAIVRTGDLDLNSREGLKELDRRIRRAAQSVCPPRDRQYLYLANRCIKRAAEEAWQSFLARRPNAVERAETSRPMRTEGFEPSTRGESNP